MLDPAAAVRASVSPGLRMALQLGRERAHHAGLRNVAPPAMLLGLLSVLEPGDLRRALAWQEAPPDVDHLRLELGRLDSAVRRSGHDPERLRAHLAAQLAAPAPVPGAPPPPALRPHTHCTLWYGEAHDLAAADPRATAGTELHHLWRGLLAHPDGSVHRTLEAVGPGVREALDLLDAPGATWEVGEVVSDASGSFEVLDVITAGAQGLVYRVRHREWDRELAVKAPRLEQLTEDSLLAFLDEARTWVALPPHPHVVGALVARTYRGLPRVVAEWVDGGSLADAMASGRLYDGDERTALARVLDVAIQTAWGLHHAHEHSLVHQDVKPANVMLRRDGTALVTDLGMARARVRAAGLPADLAALAPGATTVAGLSGYTPLYCSPEQAHGLDGRGPGLVTRATDVWSWAVTVLETVVGKVPTRLGPDARATLDGCRRRLGRTRTAVPLPRPLADLLDRALDPDPGTRPRDLGALAAELVALHTEVVGLPYPRRAPRAGAPDLDALVHQGLAMHELGLHGVAVGLWEEVLASDPSHPFAAYDRALSRWRSGLVDDLQVLRELVAARASDPAHPDDPVHDLLDGLVALERGDGARARLLLGTVAARLPGSSAARTAEELALRWAPNPQPDAGTQLDAAAVTSIAVRDGGTVAAAGCAVGRVHAIASGPWQAAPGSTAGPAVVATEARWGGAWAAGYADGRVVVRPPARAREPLPEPSFTADAGAAVTAIALDAHEVLVGTAHGRVFSWTLATGAVVELSAGRVDAVAVLADRAVVVPDAGGTRVQDYAGATIARVDDVVRTVPTADGEHLLTEHPDGTLCARATRTGGVLHRWSVDRVGPGPYALSPGGDLLAAVGPDLAVRVWTATRCLRTLPAPRGAGPTALAIGAAGTGRPVLHLGFADGLLASVGLPHTDALAPWQLPHPDRATARDTAQRLLDRIDDAARAGDADAIAAGLATLRELPDQRRAARTMRRLRMTHPDPRRVPVAFAARAEQQRPPGPVPTTALTDDGDAYVVQDADGTTSLHRSDGSGVVARLPGRLLGAARDHVLCLADDGASALVLDARRGERVTRLPLTGDPTAAVLAARGTRLLDGAGVLLDVATAAVVDRLDLVPGARVALSYDGTSVAWGDGPVAVVLQPATGRRRELVEPGTTSPVTAVHLDEAGALAVAVHADGAVRSWDVQRSQVLARVAGTRDGSALTRTLALSADGRLALEAGVQLTLWDPGTGARHRVGGGAANVHASAALSLTPDGRVALTRTPESLTLWHVDRSFLGAGPQDDAFRGDDRGDDLAHAVPLI